MLKSCFSGTPRQIGTDYGKRFAGEIRENLQKLVLSGAFGQVPREEASFIKWWRHQEQLIAERWPWLLSEIRAVADAVGRDYEDLLLLNLRCWRYTNDLAQPGPGDGCSSMAVRLSDGTIANAGALDDPAELYCGAVRIVPDEGYRYISFPITGTSWGNRGLNSAGLSIGVSTQALPGLKALPEAMAFDLPTRAMLQTCATVGEVREFCRSFPFTLNLLCVDAEGGIFWAHHTAAGLCELPVTGGGCAVTNHVVDDHVAYQLARHGLANLTADRSYSHQRRGNLLGFLASRAGSCTAPEVRDYVGLRDDTDVGAVHSGRTVCVTFANPQADKTGLWVKEGSGDGPDTQFERLEV